MKKLLILCAALLALAGCKKTASVHPDWTYGSVMYEVNIRQFSPEGRRGFKTWGRKIPWRRKWQPTLVFLPGESHGQRSLPGYRL